MHGHSGAVCSLRRPDGFGQRSQLKSHKGQRQEGREKCIYRFLTAEVVRWRKGAELMAGINHEDPVDTEEHIGQRQRQYENNPQGHHTMKQKGAMFFDAKYFLQHEYNLRSASRIVLFVHFIDQWGHPLTHLPNGNPINRADMVVNSPYHCAADLYRAGELFEHSHPSLAILKDSRRPARAHAFARYVEVEQLVPEMQETPFFVRCFSEYRAS